MTLKSFGLMMVAIITMMMTPAYALTLDEARAQGIVGEQLDGFIGVVKDAPGVSSFVANENMKRNLQYVKTSQEKGKSIDEVAQAAALQNIEELPAGSFYQGADGKWVTK